MKLRLAITHLRLVSPILIVFASGVANAQFSPGDLAKGHSDLEGVSKCEKCHQPGGGVTAERCLACHTELKPSVDKGQGYHGHLTSSERSACQNCHRDHLGKDFALVDWGPGKNKFDHTKTGFTLKGKHSDVKCDDCHEKRLIKKADVVSLLAKQPGRKTLLGLETSCKTCHFDEHRSKLGTACQDCHQEKAWKEAKFDHDKTAYKLTGMHKKVVCNKCHDSRTDDTTPADAFPKPRANTFVGFDKTPHDSCTDCHKDPHKGQLGHDCTTCHTTAGWKNLASVPKDVAFHDKTHFPLKGAHRTAKCNSCHGPFPSRPSMFKDLPHDTCATCHFDAHLGQLDPKKDCDTCHTVAAWKPVHFETEQHAKARFVLEGAHQAAPCSACHQENAGLVTPFAARLKQATKKGIVAQTSAVVLRLPKVNGACTDCHADEHRGQFNDRQGGKDCATCHNQTSFHALKFDHTRDTSFALTGKHSKTACISCHPAKIEKGKTQVNYASASKNCESCHRDIHLGQFAKTQGKVLSNDCARCHNTDAFKPTLFNHNDKTFTRFALSGKHQTTACTSCHKAITIKKDLSALRYVKLPTACESCHVDAHEGKFAQFGTCDTCHSTDRFVPASFNHDNTGFPLKGRHSSVTCQGCHMRSFAASLPTNCAACHRDVHAGEMGTTCENCHSEQNWEGQFDAIGHRRTNMPLVGKHAVLPCVSCHPNIRDRSGARAASPCASCHEKDFVATAGKSLDHVALGFGQRCEDCHSFWRFTPATLPQHDSCFQITGGPHGGIACRTCHTSIPKPATFSGACNTGTAACTGCHTHSCANTDRRHREVPGYECRDQKCYSCHQFAD